MDSRSVLRGVILAQFDLLVESVEATLGRSANGQSIGHLLNASRKLFEVSADSTHEAGPLPSLAKITLNGEVISDDTPTTYDNFSTVVSPLPDMNTLEHVSANHACLVCRGPAGSHPVHRGYPDVNGIRVVMLCHDNELVLVSGEPNRTSFNDE